MSRATYSRLLASLALVAMPMAAPLARGAVPPTPALTIDIRNFAFTPGKLAIPVGSRVVWTNRDEEPHIVVSAGGNFPSSPGLDTGDTYAFTFSKPGTYTYYCSIHPMMVGTIVVQ